MGTYTLATEGIRVTEPESTPDDRTPFWSLHRLLTAGMTAVVLIVALFLLLDRGEPYVEPVDSGHDASRNVLSVALSYCGATYASGVVETETEVSVWIYPITPIHRGGIQPACADGVEIQLREPLGSRTVIDGRTGNPIPFTE